MIEKDRAIRLNENIANRAMEEIEKDYLNKNTCDLSDMRILSMAIDNIKDIEKIWKIKEEHLHEKEERSIAPYTRKTYTESEFMECANRIISERGDEGVHAIIMTLDETVDDLKILHKKMYDNLMKKLKEL